MADPTLELFDPRNPGTVRTRDKKTGQFGWAMRVGDEVRFFPDEVDPSEDVGIGEAIAIGAGEFTTTVFDRMDAAMTGETPEDLARSQQLLQPLRERRPFATSIGQSVPSMAIPGGKAVQTVVGAAEGALVSPERPVSGAIEGAAASLVGGEIAERTFRWLRGMGNDALAVLARNKVPTTRAQRGQVVAEAISPAIEAVPFLNRWLAAPARAQQLALNRSAAEGLGFGGRAAKEPLTPQRLGLAKRGIQSKFDEVENAIPDTTLPPDIAEQLADLNVIGRNERELLDLTGQLDGAGLMRVRSALNQEVADLALDGKMNAARALRVTLNRVDEIIEAGIDNPAIMATWQEARQQWRLLTALQRGQAVSGQGNVNLASARTALRTIYPNFRTGSPLPGAGQNFGDLVTALDELPKVLQSSGTAERQTAANLLLGGGALSVIDPFAAAAGAGVPAFVAGTLVEQPGARVGAAAARPVERAVMDEVDRIFGDEPEDDTDNAAAE